jgi:hypothetical protein
MEEHKWQKTESHLTPASLIGRKEVETQNTQKELNDDILR